MNIYAVSAHPHSSGSNSDPDANDFTSNTIKLFTEIIERRPGGQILDLGTACNENIQFFIRRIHRLVACDMFSRLADSFHGNHPSHQIWRHLDYPVESFDGILLWDLIDRLEEPDVTILADLCHSMVKPGGLVVLFVLGEQQLAPVVNSFVIGQDFRVHLRPQPQLHLPLRSRHNRDVLTLMSAFTLVRSFVCRQGLREFIFRRDQ